MSLGKEQGQARLMENSSKISSKSYRNKDGRISRSIILGGLEEMVWESKVVDGQFVLAMKQWEEQESQRDQVDVDNREEQPVKMEDSLEIKGLKVKAKVTDIKELKQKQNNQEQQKQKIKQKTVKKQDITQLQQQQKPKQQQKQEKQQQKQQSSKQQQQSQKEQQLGLNKEVKAQILKQNIEGEKEDVQQSSEVKQQNEVSSKPQLTQVKQAQIKPVKQEQNIEEQKKQQPKTITEDNINNNEGQSEKLKNNQLQEHKVQRQQSHTLQQETKQISVKQQQNKLEAQHVQIKQEQEQKPLIDKKQQNHQIDSQLMNQIRWISQIVNNKFDLRKERQQKQDKQQIIKPQQQNQQLIKLKEQNNSTKKGNDQLLKEQEQAVNQQSQVLDNQQTKIKRQQQQVVNNDKIESQSIINKQQQKEKIKQQGKQQVKQEVKKQQQVEQAKKQNQQQSMKQPQQIEQNKNQDLTIEKEKEVQIKQSQPIKQQQKQRSLVLKTQSQQEASQLVEQYPKEKQQHEEKQQREVVQSPKNNEIEKVSIKRQATIQSEFQIHKPAEFQIKKSQKIEAKPNIQTKIKSNAQKSYKQQQKSDFNQNNSKVITEKKEQTQIYKLKTSQDEEAKQFQEKQSKDDKQGNQQLDAHPENQKIEEDNPPIQQSETEDLKPTVAKQNIQKIQTKSISKSPSLSKLNNTANKASVAKNKFLDNPQQQNIKKQEKPVINNNTKGGSQTIVHQKQQQQKIKINVVEVQTQHRQRLSIARKVFSLSIFKLEQQSQSQMSQVPNDVERPQTQQKSHQQKDQLRNQIDILKQTINQLTKNKPARRSVRKQSSGDIRTKKIHLKTNQKESPRMKPKQESDVEQQYSPTNGYQQNELVMKIKRKQAEFQKFIKSTKLSRLQLHRSSKVNPKADNFTQSIHQSNSSAKVDLMIDLPEDYRLIEKKQHISTDSQKYKQISFPKLTASIKQKVALLPEPPTFEMKSKELTIIGKAAFKIFDVQIDQDEVLKINKYRNCVYFGIGDSHILWHYSGQFYIGDWKIKEEGQGCKQGLGIQYIPQKYIYEGEFVNGKREGKGRMESFMNEIYQGYWRDGKRDGFGKLIDSFGKVSHGKWSNGKKVDQTEHAEVADDQFKKQEFPNGDTYEGNYLNQKFQGQGKYVWKDGSFYVGEFIAGLRHGYGVWRSATHGGDTYQGNYKDDKKSGRGKYTWSNGTIYIGNFQKDLKHGQGQLKFLDGRTINLNSFNGIPLNYHHKSANQTPKDKRSLDTAREYETPGKHEKRHQGSAIKWSLKKINQNREFCRSVQKNRKNQ